MHLRRSLAALLLVTALSPATAFAQSDADKATARDLTVEGYALLEKKDFANAADKFKRADALFHAPTITLGLARAYAGLGKLMSAQEAYSRAAHETVPPNASAAFSNAVADAQRELAALAPRVPGVIINVKGPTEPKVTLDGADVPNAALGVKRPVDPGSHVIKVTASGFFPGEATVSVAEAKIESVTIELKPGGPVTQPPPPPAGGPAQQQQGAGIAPPPGGDTGAPVSSTQKTLGIVGLGVGGAGLLVGAITGGLALSKHSALLANCKDGHCPKGSEMTYQSDIDSYKTMGTISTAGFIAGGALAVTGVVLMETAPKAKKTGAITPVIGLGYVGAQGGF
jgi:hypothetical protein